MELGIGWRWRNRNITRKRRFGRSFSPSRKVLSSRGNENGGAPGLEVSLFSRIRNVRIAPLALRRTDEKTSARRNQQAIARQAGGSKNVVR